MTSIAHRVPEDNTLTRQTRRVEQHTCRPVSWRSARTPASKTRTKPRRLIHFGRVSTRNMLRRSKRKTGPFELTKRVAVTSLIKLEHTTGRTIALLIIGQVLRSSVSMPCFLASFLMSSSKTLLKERGNNYYRVSYPFKTEQLFTT